MKKIIAKKMEEKIRIFGELGRIAKENAERKGALIPLAILHSA